MVKLILWLMKKDIVKSHLKKKAQSKLALSISLFIVLLTSTGYIFNSIGVIFLFYISCFIFLYNLVIHFLLEKFDIQSWLKHSLGQLMTLCAK